MFVKILLSLSLIGHPTAVKCLCCVQPVGKPVSSAYSHVKPKVYEATEAHVRSSRAAISAANHNVVTQFQVVVGSDHPIRRVSTEGNSAAYDGLHFLHFD